MSKKIELAFKKFNSVLKFLEKEYNDTYEIMKYSYPLWSKEISKRERELIKFEENFTGKREIHDKVWAKWEKCYLDKQMDFYKKVLGEKK